MNDLNPSNTEHKPGRGSRAPSRTDALAQPSEDDSSGKDMPGELYHDTDLPVAVILGRPNTGKSTLFNRLVKKRRAITDHTPGVTRDPVEDIFDLNGRPVRLFDTGGIRLSQDAFDDLVTRKSYEAVQRADVVVLLLDVRNISPEDETVIEYLRPYKNKILAAVNKVDHPKHENYLGDFYAFGFDRLFPISASHGTGIDALLHAMEKTIDFSKYAEALPDRSGGKVRLAVLGKPNTGKSTLVNTVLGGELSITSDIPGTTRDVISGSFVYRSAQYQILDTAGIRKKKKVHEDIEYYSVNRAIRSIDQSDVILLMVDSLEGVTDQDKKIAALMTRKGKGVVVVLNKWDLIVQDMKGSGKNGITADSKFQAIKDRVHFVFPVLSFAPVVPISALYSEGMEQLLNSVWGVWKQLNRRVETSRFNEMLQLRMEHHEPPRDAKGRFKVFYGTQVSSNPVRFLLFVNRKKGFPKTYIQYILNSIRSDLGFPSVPISVELKERQRREIR